MPETRHNLSPIIDSLRRETDLARTAYAEAKRDARSVATTVFSNVGAIFFGRFGARTTDEILDERREEYVATSQRTIVAEARHLTFTSTDVTTRPDLVRDSLAQKIADEKINEDRELQRAEVTLRNETLLGRMQSAYERHPLAFAVGTLAADAAIAVSVVTGQLPREVILARLALGTAGYDSILRAVQRNGEMQGEDSVSERIRVMGVDAVVRSSAEYSEVRILEGQQGVRNGLNDLQEAEADYIESAEQTNLNLASIDNPHSPMPVHPHHPGHPSMVQTIAEGTLAVLPEINAQKDRELRRQRSIRATRFGISAALATVMTILTTQAGTTMRFEGGDAYFGKPPHNNPDISSIYGWAQARVAEQRLGLPKDSFDPYGDKNPEHNDLLRAEEEKDALGVAQDTACLTRVAVINTRRPGRLRGLLNRNISDRDVEIWIPADVAINLKVCRWANDPLNLVP